MRSPSVGYWRYSGGSFCGSLWFGRNPAIVRVNPFLGRNMTGSTTIGLSGARAKFVTLEVKFKGARKAANLSPSTAVFPLSDASQPRASARSPCK